MMTRAESRDQSLLGLLDEQRNRIPRERRSHLLWNHLVGAVGQPLVPWWSILRMHDVNPAAHSRNRSTASLAMKLSKAAISTHQQVLDSELAFHLTISNED